MRGIGERIEPLDAGGSLPMLLAHPGVALSTAAVFAGLDRFDAPRAAAPPSADRDALLDHLATTGNALEEPALRLAPAVGRTLEALRTLPGCRLARMSGSGATCFALFGTEAGLHAASDALAAEPLPFAWLPVLAGHGATHAGS
jgi:4-diphosphocytidyl-2-C-methyl-D-erythritol kinase